MYHYISCGLDNIYLKNGFTIEDGPHGKGVSIKDIDGLHAAIAKGVVNKKGIITPKEFKFLRHELDLSQKALGTLLDKSDQIVAKWEKGESDIHILVDKAIRDIYQESIGEGHISGLLDTMAKLDRSIHEIDLEIERIESVHEWSASARHAA